MLETNATLAAEAAAAQGRFEEANSLLLESPAQGVESQESQADLCRTFAVELGLDMDAYDAAMPNPETRARVNTDLVEGRALGVFTAPTFFVDGEPLEFQRWNDLEEAIAHAFSTAR